MHHVTVEAALKAHSVFSFFSGSGLLDLAFEEANFRVDFVNEYFGPFADAYRYSREKMGIPLPKYGINICSIDEFLEGRWSMLRDSIAEAKTNSASVGFIGGPPCPDFSVGGKNKGVLGSNGKLSRSYFNLILKAKPDWFIFENVKGLWRTKKHREFYDEMKAALAEKYVVSERLFNSIEAGAPQDRDRIILFGVLKKHKAKMNLDWDYGLPFPKRAAFEEYEWIQTTSFCEGSSLAKPNNVPLELTVQYWFDRNNVEKHPNFNDCFKPKAGLQKFKVIAEGDVSRKSSKRLHRWRYSPTAAYGNNEVHLHPFRARRINVAEALSLQSMPAAFCLPPHMTLSNKFKTIGNGVPFLLGSHIALRVKEFLDQNFKEKV